MDGYGSMPSMNQFIFIEMDDCVDFSYLNYFATLYKCNHNRHYILEPFMFMLQ